MRRACHHAALKGCALRSWQRTEAFLLRPAHPRGAWLFVDLLAALRRPDAPQQLALVVIFFAQLCAHFLEKSAIPRLPDLVRMVNHFSMETIKLTPLNTLKLKEQLLALSVRNASKEAFGTGSRPAHLGHHPEPGVKVLACAILRRSALAAGMHISVHAPVACISVSTKLQSCTSLARARHFYAAWLSISKNQYAAPPTCRASCPAISRAGAHSRPRCRAHLSAASKANVEWLLQCFQADLACPLRSKMVSVSLAYSRRTQRVGRSAEPRQHVRIRQQAASSLSFSPA